MAVHGCDIYMGYPFIPLGIWDLHPLGFYVRRAPASRAIGRRRDRPLRVATHQLWHMASDATIAVVQNNSIIWLTRICRTIYTQNSKQH